MEGKKSEKKKKEKENRELMEIVLNSYFETPNREVKWNEKKRREEKGMGKRREEMKKIREEIIFFVFFNTLRMALSI